MSRIRLYHDSGAVHQVCYSCVAGSFVDLLYIVTWISVATFNETA